MDSELEENSTSIISTTGISETQVQMAAVNNPRPTLLWIQTQDLNQILDSATWLTTASELREKGWQVFLVQSGSIDSAIEVRDGLLTIPKSELWLFGQIIYHWRIVRWLFTRDDIDVVLIHDESTIFMLPVRILYTLLRRKRPKFIVDYRTLFMPPSTGLSTKGKLRAFYLRHINRFSDYWIDGYLAITEHLAQAVGIKPERLLGV